MKSTNLSIRHFLLFRNHSADNIARDEVYGLARMAQRTRDQPVIPNKRNREVDHQCDPEIFKQRNIVERMFCRFKDWHGVAVRTLGKIEFCALGRGFAKIVLRPARKGSPPAFSAVGDPFLQSTTPSSVSATRIRKQLIDYVKKTPITTRVHRQSHCPAALPHLPRRRSGSPRHLRPSGQHRSSRWSVFQV